MMDEPSQKAYRAVVSWLRDLNILCLPHIPAEDGEAYCGAFEDLRKRLRDALETKPDDKITRSTRKAVSTKREWMDYEHTLMMLVGFDEDGEPVVGIHLKPPLGPEESDLVLVQKAMRQMQRADFAGRQFFDWSATESGRGRVSYIPGQMG
jgi:hypothetical protein